MDALTGPPGTDQGPLLRRRRQGRLAQAFGRQARQRELTWVAATTTLPGCASRLHPGGQGRRRTASSAARGPALRDTRRSGSTAAHRCRADGAARRGSACADQVAELRAASLHDQRAATSAGSPRRSACRDRGRRDALQEWRFGRPAPPPGERPSSDCRDTHDSPSRRIRCGLVHRTLCARCTASTRRGRVGLARPR